MKNNADKSFFWLVFPFSHILIDQSGSSIKSADQNSWRERERERGLPLPCNHVKYCQEIFCHERKLQDKTKLLKCYAKHEYKNKLKRNSLLNVDRPKKAKMICWINSQWTVVFIDKMNTGNLISAKTEKYLTKPLHRVVRVFCNWLNYSIGQYAYQTNENNTWISEL